MNILIIEDENHTAQLLKEMIESESENLIIGVLESIEEGARFIEKHKNKIDLIFLDIHLADGICFELFDQVEVSTPVVFCTAYDSYALQAFQSNGVGYILKPFREKDIREVFEKLETLGEKWHPNSELNQQLKTEIQADTPTQASFLVQFRDKMFPVAIDDIGAVALEHETVYLYRLSGQKYPIFKTLEQIEKVLNPKDFFRVNRQMLIRRQAIQEIEPYFNRKVVVNLSFELAEKAIVSRLKVSPFLAWVENPSNA